MLKEVIIMPDIESLEPKVDFIRGTESQISNLAITDGQFIVSEEGNIYVDIDNERVSIKENDIIAVYEKSPTTASHSVDDYIYYNNKLYRVILAIAIGDTITIGTNVELANDIEVGTKVYISGLPESTGGGVQAIDVGYDNTESGLTSDNVQDSIDELSLKKANGEGLTFSVDENGILNVAYSIPFEYVTWASSSDEHIVAMIEAADNGEIDLSDYWSVGDERTVHLNAMSATGVGESHEEQDVVLVLSHQGGKTLTTPTASGRTTCSFQFDMKHGLYNRGYMNSTNTNVGGWTNCARRTWCNSVFKNAVPNTLSPIFKQHKNLTSAGNQSSTIDTTDDWFALRSEIEIFGTTTYSFAGEGSQVTYYQTSANRIKQSQGTNYFWWERSPLSFDTDSFCNVDSDGSASGGDASTSLGLAVCGCI